MSDNKLIPVNPEFAKKAWITKDKYKAMYEESIKDPDKFWGKMAEELEWIKKWTLLGFEYLGCRNGIKRISSESINCFSRKSNNPS